jgi:dTDP-4-amino-4,6-dideoxygalactose transaminase
MGDDHDQVLHHVRRRRYFYPLIAEFPMYRGLPSARRENLPVASTVAEQVICLSVYPALTFDDQDRIIERLADRHRRTRGNGTGAEYRSP